MLYLVEPAALTLSSSATVLIFSGPTRRTRAILAGMSFGGPFRKKTFYNNLGKDLFTPENVNVKINVEYIYFIKNKIKNGRIYA